jgi:hypothetical protein
LTRETSLEALADPADDRLEVLLLEPEQLRVVLAERVVERSTVNFSPTTFSITASSSFCETTNEAMWT